jgi:DNA sulfur modification protein DndD
MIFTELVMHNFGIYRGRHTVDLTPHSREKPILLFGGLNGGGKTTFLDAMKLALYGKLADCSNRKDLSYDQFLAAAINRYCPPKEGAALELEFLSNQGGVESRFRVKRYWKKNQKTVSEKVEVIQDRAFNPVLSKHWAQYVDEFIPQDIANLFFFDGEKIESLADKSTSAAIIKTGIHSLLGLNVIDRLDSDLRELTKRRVKKKNDNPTTDRIEQIDKELDSLARRREDRVTLRGQLRKVFEDREAELDRSKTKLQASGGNFFVQREENLMLLNEVDTKLQAKRSEMQELASGIAPLLLVKDLISKARKQSELEETVTTSSAVNKAMRSRDSRILSLIKKRTSGEIYHELNQWMSNDTQKRESEAAQECYLDCKPSVFNDVREQDLALTQSVAKEILAEHIALEEEKSFLEQQLAATPEEAAIKPLLDEVNRLESATVNDKAKMLLIDDEMDLLERQIGELQSDQRSLNLTLIDTRYDQDKINLINGRSKKVSDTLALYRKVMLERHLRQLEELILDSFSALARKTNLLSKIEIDPATFEITVFDANKEGLPTDRLSAGERQLFAVSILWGLAKASGRPLPAIVDTPLGRLDSKHRTHLVENYFPRASHQVILLSTDEEIDQRYRKKLSKHIGKEYHIQYVPDEKTSSISEGYF